VLGVGTAFELLNFAFDIYGVLRNPAGRRLVPYTNERASKFLYSLRHVPTNFDGVIVGSSISANLRASELHHYRVYNLSISGSNISEQRILLDNILRVRAPRFVLFCIYPYLTQDHGTKGSGMDPQDRSAAWGSPQLLRDYAVASFHRLGAFPLRFDWAGWQDIRGTGKALDADATLADWKKRQSLPKQKDPFAIDPIALAEYRDLLSRVHSAGSRVVGFIPPIYAPRFELLREEFTLYDGRILALFDAGDSVVDFNAPRFRGLTSDPASFYDGYHLAQKAADRLVAELNRTLDSETSVRH
jgi:hypothetical protein